MSLEVKVEIYDHIVEITIDRPPANAINPGVSRAIYEALSKLQDDDDLRVGIITGAGERIFSAGWDLKEIAAFDNNEDAVNSAIDCPGGFAGITEFWGLKKPVISAINGMAVGGGFEIALSTDLIVAADHAEFFLPEMQRGFLPDVGAIQILPRKLPYNVAMELLYTGRRMSAQEAAQWGLVCRVCPASELMSQARALAREVAQGAPLALQAIKRTALETHTLPWADAFKFEMEQAGNVMMSKDAREGPRAFKVKRPAVFNGV
jgi:crotonobetainyl-CoA hydratase